MKLTLPTVAAYKAEATRLLAIRNTVGASKTDRNGAVTAIRALERESGLRLY